jgi:hypothetical protein
VNTPKRHRVKMRPPTESDWWEAKLILSRLDIREETRTQITGWYDGNYITVLKSSIEEII